jgi:hypothetical protein
MNKERVQRKEITAATALNYVKTMKLFCEMMIFYYHGRELLEVSQKQGGMLMIGHGKKDFHCTIERVENILERVYSKDLKGKHKLRDETLESSNKNPFEAIEEKLNCVDSNPSHSTQLPKKGTYQESDSESESQFIEAGY